MNKKVIGIIVAVIIIALGVFIIMRGKKSSDDTTQVASTNSAQQPAQTESSESSSIKTLLATGQSKKCTYSNTQGDVKTDGTVYVGDSKFRGDFTTTAAGKATYSHMIQDGKEAYLWTDGMSTGILMKLDTNKPAPTTAPSGSVDTEKNFDFHCQGWTVDSAMFTLPGGMPFTDAAGAMTPSMNVTAACDKLTEPAKTQCMGMLKK